MAKFIKKQEFDSEYGFNLTNQEVETSITNFNLYKDTAQSTPTTGTGGTALYLSKELNTTTPLIGKGSFLLTKSANNAQGEGFNYAFTIDRGQVASTAQVSFCYETSANYADGDIGVYIYDVTNGTILYPSIVSLPATYGKPSNHLVTFIPTTSNSYRLVFHVQTTSTLAYTLGLDNIQIGNKQVAIGASIGNWKTISAKAQLKATTTNPTVGTTVSDLFAWRRVGDVFEFKIHLQQSTAGSSGSGLYYFELPDGLTANMSKLLEDSSGGSVVGSIYFNDITNTIRYNGIASISPTNPNRISMYLFTAIDNVSQISNTVGATGGSAERRWDLYGAIPILQWTSNINLTSDFSEYASNSSTTDANDTTSFVYGPNGSVFPGNLTTSTRAKRVRFKNPIQPTDKFVLEINNGASNVWVEPRLGLANVIWEGFNGISPISSTDVDVRFGQYAFGTTVWSTYSTWRWRVRKVSNGNMAEVPPTVYAATTSSAISVTADNPINMSSVSEDTHNAITTGASWKFTAPISGLYLFTSRGSASGTTHNITIYRNGVGSVVIGTVITGGNYYSMSRVVRASAGDYLDIRPSVNSTGAVYSMTIVRLGS